MPCPLSADSAWTVGGMHGDMVAFVWRPLPKVRRAEVIVVYSRRWLTDYIQMVMPLDITGYVQQHGHL
jgi:hypothetical protein